MLIIPHSQDHSREILDTDTWNRFAADPTKPALVSFPRTGSHWLRILMELLFQRPTLVRAFFYFENQDYLCWHTHDNDLKFQRNNIIYLYRDPLDTVYSQLRYLGVNISDPKAVETCAAQYREHLGKWLLRESFAHRKLLVTYRDLEDTPLKILHALATFFELPWDAVRAQEVVNYVTRDVVSNKTKEHDARVINTQHDYSASKQSFRAQHAALIDEVVFAGEPGLQAFFRR